jgi:PAP2 superfamily
MEERETAAVWNLFRLNWILICGVAIAFGLGLLLTDFQVRPQSYLIVLGVAGAYGSFGWRNAGSSTRQNPRIAFPLTAIAQIVVVIPVMTSISYVTTSVNLPLMDATLLAYDRALGFDFRSYLSFINERPWLIWILATGYRAIACWVLVIVVILPLAGYYRRVAEFIGAFTLALISTTCISAVVPAIGVYGELGLTVSDFSNIVPQGYYDTLRDAPLLRDGTLRSLDLLKLVGVLTFPSFHAVSAVLYAWALWPVRRFRPVNLFCNGAMIAATPVGGGHYLVDVIAGVAVAALSIFVSRRVSRAVAMEGEPVPQQQRLAGSRY